MCWKNARNPGLIKCADRLALTGRLPCSPYRVRTLVGFADGRLRCNIYCAAANAIYGKIEIQILTFMTWRIIFAFEL
jgi:hypothetical protein